MNFKESVMSKLPSTLPKRTRTIVKDILFQEKYNLSHTEVDLMAYIFNALNWSMQVDGHLVLNTNKFRQDLPQIGEKSLEASLRTLKDRNLIEVDMVSVPIWRNSKARGIKITSLGLEYNASLYKPDEKKVMKHLQVDID